MSVYSFDSRVRYSETDQEGRLSILAMMNYLQDCSTFQSEDGGVGLAYLARKQCAWWVHSWNICIGRIPVLGDVIRIATWAYDFRGIFGYRNFVIDDPEGRHLVKADSTWFFYDRGRQAPVRPEAEDTAPYGLEPRLDMPSAPHHLRLPSGGETGEAIMIMPHHLDTNGHVNNAQYVEMARECLPERMRIGRIEAEYRKAAWPGDILVPHRVRQDGIWTVSLSDDRDQVCALIRLTPETGRKAGEGMI